jgi:DNA-binding NarL/FixJ family response regulator
VADELTERQNAIARLVGEGLSNRQISERFGISISAVQGHINAILNKLVLHERRQIEAWARARARRLSADGKRMGSHR